jgi:hypothetical protein
MLPTLLSTIAGKLAALGAAGAVTVGGLAAAGALPAPAQERLADLADRVGVELPTPSVAPGGPPEGAPPAVPDETPDPTLPEPARDGMAHAADLRADAAARAEAARAHAARMQEWTSCIREAAAAHDEASGELDPQEACGPRPVLTMPVPGDEAGADDEGAAAKTSDRRPETPGDTAGAPDPLPVPESVPPVTVPEDAEVPAVTIPAPPAGDPRG